MSSIYQKNVKTLLMGLLAEEEVDLNTANEEVQRCLSVLDNHRIRIDSLKKALNALGETVRLGVSQQPL